MDIQTITAATTAVEVANPFGSNNWSAAIKPAAGAYLLSADGDPNIWELTEGLVLDLDDDQSFWLATDSGTVDVDILSVVQI